MQLYPESIYTRYVAPLIHLIWPWCMSLSFFSIKFCLTTYMGTDWNLTFLALLDEGLLDRYFYHPPLYWFYSCYLSYLPTHRIYPCMILIWVWYMMCYLSLSILAFFSSHWMPGFAVMPLPYIFSSYPLDLSPDYLPMVPLYIITEQWITRVYK